MSATGSGIEGLRADNALARLVGESLKTETFKLIDIGCSGGLPQGFRAFGERLEALAFDGLDQEVARLTAAEENPLVRYVAGLIGLPADHPLRRRIGHKGPWHNWPSFRYPYERHADLRAAKAEGRTPSTIDEYYSKTVLGQDWSTTPWHGFDLDYAASFEVYPAPEAQIKPDKDGMIHLSAFLKGAKFEDADFLKIDIDGPDWEVLRSATDLLQRPSLLGVALEVNFIGSHDANDNTFHNMDRLMREKGFHLFGLSVRTYSSAALPFTYLDAHPSMNEGGRPVQGDAVYIRDLASRTYAAEAAALSDEKLAKTAALLAMFSVPDYAAEMLLVHRMRLSRLFDVEKALDLLAAQIQENEPKDSVKAYRQYVAAFEAEEPEFFDLYTRRNTWMAGVLEKATNHDQLAETLRIANEAVGEAKAEREILLQRLEDGAQREAAMREEIAKAQRDLVAVRASTSWKVTAPLRRLLGRR